MAAVSGRGLRWCILCGLIAMILNVVDAQRGAEYFQRLGLQPGASDKEVKKAFKKLVRTLHPDAVPEAEREEARRRFLEVTEAYETLSDPAKREAYESTGRRPTSSGDDRQYLRHNLFTQDFDGVELKEDAMRSLESGAIKDTYFVYFWSSNFPDCIDFAAPFKLLASRLRGTSVNVASFKCDVDPMPCRRLQLGSLPRLVLFRNGKPTHYPGKIEIVALTHFASQYLDVARFVHPASVAALFNTTPSPYGAVEPYGIAGSYLWETSKRSHRGRMAFELVTLEYSPCYDCETALHLALETIAPIYPDTVARRIDCSGKRGSPKSNAEFCAAHQTRNRAWSLLRVERTCWYATKKPFTFSNEHCGPLKIKTFDGKYANDAIVQFLVAERGSRALPWTPSKAFDMTKANDSFAVLFDDGDASTINTGDRVHWALLAQQLNVNAPFVNAKGHRLWIATADCIKYGNMCAGLGNHPRPFVAVYAFGTKAKQVPPVISKKLTGWKAMLKDLERDAEPLHLHILTPKNYDQKITKGLKKNKHWLVLYNAGEWCPPCNQIRDPWKVATRLVQNSEKAKKLSVAMVECDQHKKLCNSLGIDNYPTMSFLAKGRAKVEYNGPRDGHEIAKFALDLVDNRLLPLSPPEVNQRIRRGETLIACFSAGSWCPPCTQIAPVIKKLANELKDIPVTSINCDDAGRFCHGMNIEGYPTVVLYHRGGRHVYEGQKEVGAIQAWARKLVK